MHDELHQQKVVLLSVSFGALQALCDKVHMVVCDLLQLSVGVCIVRSSHNL